MTRRQERAVPLAPPLPARGERWRKWLCLAPQDANSNAIALPHAGRGGASGIAAFRLRAETLRLARREWRLLAGRDAFAGHGQAHGNRDVCAGHRREVDALLLA